MSELKVTIQEAMKQAMKAQEKERLSVIRMILAAIKQQEVDTRIEVTDHIIIEILTKMIKKNRESIEQFRAAAREDLIAKEDFEMKVIKGFLPEQLSEEEIRTAIQEALSTTGAESIKDMAKVMQYLRRSLLGKADLDLIGKIVKELLVNKSK